MNRVALLSKLPPYRGQSEIIVSSQNSGDIIREMLTAHRLYANDYERIAGDFHFNDRVIVMNRIFDFLKSNIVYKQESEHEQTSKSPAAILATMTGDCKHYSLFTAGLLDALSRNGFFYDWSYRFACYDSSGIPSHVFVVVDYAGREYWIDPVLKQFDSRSVQPVSWIDKKIKSMALKRVSGLQNITATNSGNDYVARLMAITGCGLVADGVVSKMDGPSAMVPVAGKGDVLEIAGREMIAQVPGAAQEKTWFEKNWLWLAVGGVIAYKVFNK